MAQTTNLLRLLQSDRDEITVICDIRDQIAQFSGAKVIEIFQIEPRLNRYFRWNREGPDSAGESLHRHDPLVGLAERERRLLTPSDWSALPIPEGRPKFLGPIDLILPLHAGRNLVGLVILGEMARQDQEVMDQLEEARGLLGFLLEMSRLKGLVIEDPSTGLRSHDYFSYRLGDEIERAHRYGRKISLVILRLDPLREQLALVPPMAQDRILRQVGNLLLENTRRSSVVAEFVSDSEVFQILMPEIPSDIANNLAASISSRVALTEFEGFKKHLRMIWGIATFPDDAASRQILTAKAFGALKKAQEAGEIKRPPTAGAPKHRLPDFAGELDMRNPEMISIFETAHRISDSKSTVLITGETGVGKEILAEFVHRHSGRREKSLIKVNCGALPESLVESELFGHEKGSFTGAEQRRIGRFELAHEGTIFLDEIGELTLNAQVKLLRIIEGKSFYRLGGTAPVTVDVRIVAATNRDLVAEVQKGSFREDLYYRLNVISFQIPPLRERREDIPILVARFMKDFNHENKTNIDIIHPEAMDIFYRYDWPGNVRELRNAVERAMILTGGENKILARYLPPSVLKGAQSKANPTPTAPAMSNDAIPMPSADTVQFPDLNDRQRQVVAFLRVHTYISNQQYVNMMNVSRRTCVRDLNELIDRRLVLREGKKKSCVYRLADGV